ncbi:hypothetical protein LDENG_00225100 [Lucifuga dentata]|nr:hypothetical protein LDENG_00225100 [Lucifuga dentata]
MKSRHQSIKKRRRCERLAATRQSFLWKLLRHFLLKTQKVRCPEAFTSVFILKIKIK